MKCVCKQCGKEFELSKSEIDFYRKKNLNLPKRCKECREKNKGRKVSADGSYVNQSGQLQYGDTSGGNDNRTNKIAYILLAIAAIAFIALLALPYIESAISYPVLNTPAQEYTDSQPSVLQDERNALSDAPQSAEAALPEIPQDRGAASSDITDSAQALEVPKNESADTPQTDSSAAVQMPDTESSGQGAEETAGQNAVAEITVRQYKFRKTEYMNEHYEKHGVDMGFNSAEEYQAAASAVVTNPNALHKEEAEDGDDVYYIEETNEFVIVSKDGYIRTYFYPSDGIGYYNRQ